MALAGDAAKVTFTVDRDVKVGDQSLVAIKTDTVLGAEVAGGDAAAALGSSTVDPVGPHHDSVHAEHRAAGSRRERQRAGQAEVRAGAADADRHACATRRRSCAARSTASPTCRAASTSATRRSNSCSRTPRRCPTRWLQRAGQVNQLITDGNLLFAALDERRQALSNLIAGIDDVSRPAFGLRRRQPREFRPGAGEAEPGDGQPARAARAHRRGAASGCRRTPPRSARSSARVPASRSTCTACRRPPIVGSAARHLLPAGQAARQPRRHAARATSPSA